jgi:hypothetical protein
MRFIEVYLFNSYENMYTSAFVRWGGDFLEIILIYFPLIMLFIIYYKVFRIASDIKEIKEMFKGTLRMTK